MTSIYAISAVAALVSLAACLRPTLWVIVSASLANAAAAWLIVSTMFSGG